MFQSTSCPRCLSVNKSIFHCFRDCPYAKQLCLSIGFDNINFFMDQSTDFWYKRGANGDKLSLFLATCWCIWRARNLLVSPPLEMSELLTNLVNFFRQLNNRLEHVKRNQEKIPKEIATQIEVAQLKKRQATPMARVKIVLCKLVYRKSQSSMILES